MAETNYRVGGIGTADNFQIGSQKPIDARFVVPDFGSFADEKFKTYEGLISYVETTTTTDDGKSRPAGYYKFTGGEWHLLSVNTPEELATIISAQIANETTGAMEFKGATATLPENPGKGDMYKVAGENINIVIDGKTAKAGDTIVYNNQWYLIPSGDDIEDTWRPVSIEGNELGGEEALNIVAGENVTITKKNDGSFEIASEYEDTHYESKLVVGNEATDANDENVVENNNVHLNLVEDGVVKSSHKIVGAGGITVTHATGEDGNVITIEAPEGAKYDLAAKTENNEAILSLAGTDNTEDKVAIVGNDAVSVTVNEAGKVVISAHDTTYAGEKNGEIEVTIENGKVSAALVEVGLDKLAAAIQTKLGYIDTEKNITTAIAEAINALSAEGGAIHDIVKDNGTIDVKIGKAIAALNLDTTYVKEAGFNDRVTAIKVTNAGHADTADNASNAAHATEADHAEEASVAGHASTAENAAQADEATHAETADSATYANEADQAEYAIYAGTAHKLTNALTIKVGGTDIVFDAEQKQTADVDAAIKAAIDEIPEVVHPEYSITKDAAPGAYGAVYHLTKDGAIIGEAINIPKDMVVQTGSVVVATEADKALDDKVVVGKTYIKLVIQNVAVPLYIAADQLIEYVTSGSTANDQIIVSISNDHKVTATIGAGKVGTTELADKGVTEGKLEQKVQDALALARTAIQSHQDISGKANKVTNAVAGNFAALDENGNLTDSGKKADDFATKAQGDLAASALQGITTTAGAGLKVSEKENGVQSIDIDTDLVFVLNCNF